MASKSNAVRVAVGAPAHPRSSIWRMWVQGNDVYFGARDAISAFKVSLHKSGIWRIAFVKTLDAKDKNSDRVIFKWKRPSAHLPGWTSGIAVLISSLRPKQPFEEKELVDPKIKWIPAPASGNGVTLALMLSAPGLGYVDPFMIAGGYKAIAVLRKENGENAWILCREHTLTTIQLEKVQEVMRNVKITVGADVSDQMFLDRSRAFLVTAEDQIGPSNPPTIFDVELGVDNIGKS